MPDHNDEEPVKINSESESKEKQASDISNKITIKTVQKEKASLEATDKFTLLFELEGNRSNEYEPAVDIVVVLDVSGSMKDDNKLLKMKSATKFLIKILTNKHRLSVVTFSTNANIICPLRCMTGNAKVEIGGLVDDVKAGGWTNIFGGLTVAVDILRRRKYSRGRVPSIMLISDGDQDSRFGDARLVPVDQFPVFTFGFGRGKGYCPEVLNTIANNSKGGTFSVVDVQNEESNNLNTAFALCLGWLISVVVLDLQMIISANKPGVKISNVVPNYYPVDLDNYLTTIQLGHLCAGEKRSFLVGLQLPEATEVVEYEVLEITYSYIYDGELFESKPKKVTISRTNESSDEEKIEVKTEKIRIETLNQMKTAIDLANDNRFDDAQRELQQARNSLDGLDYPIIKALKTQLEQLIGVMNSDLYKSKGHHIALSLLTSHGRQRETITNDDLTLSNLFATNATAWFAEKVDGLITDTNDEPSKRILKIVEYFQALLEAPKTNG